MLTQSLETPSKDRDLAPNYRALPSPPHRARKQRAMSQAAWRYIARRLFRQPDRWVDKLDVLNADLPRDVGVEINNVCNAKCSFCGYDKGDDGKAADPRVKRKLDVSILRHTLKLYAEAGGGVFSISPILGEVSADKRWLDFVREARSFPNITGVSCYTNGILLDRFGAEAILTSGLTNLALSTALGSSEQYIRLYGVDKYDRVVTNIFDLLETNARLGEPVSIHIELRIDKPFSTFYESEIYARLKTYLDDEDIRILDDGWDDFRGVISQSSLPKGHRLLDNVKDKSVPCYALYRKLQVMIDGTLQACSCRVEPELWGGNILQYDTLADAWRDPAIEKLRTDWHAGHLSKCCQECTHYHPYTSLIEDSRFPAVAKRVLRRALRGGRKSGAGAVAPAGLE